MSTPTPDEGITEPPTRELRNPPPNLSVAAGSGAWVSAPNPITSGRGVIYHGVVVLHGDVLRWILDDKGNAIGYETGKYAQWNPNTARAKRSTLSPNDQDQTRSP